MEIVRRPVTLINTIPAWPDERNIFMSTAHALTQGAAVDADHHTAETIYRWLFEHAQPTMNIPAPEDRTVEIYKTDDGTTYSVLMDWGHPLVVTNLVTGTGWVDEDYGQWIDAQDVDLAQSEYTDWRG